jgi:hypothetical protein
MVQTRGGTKTYPKEKSALQKINVLCMVVYGRDYYELLGPNKIIIQKFTVNNWTE